MGSPQEGGDERHGDRRAGAALPTGVVPLLFSDVEGSSRLV